MPTPNTVDILAITEADRAECLHRLGMTLDEAKALHRYLVEVIVERNRLRAEVRQLRESSCDTLPPNA